MFDKLKHYFLFGNTYYGVEHTVVENNETILVISLKKKKNNLNLVSKEHLDSFENLTNYIPKKSGITVVINNDKVLSKKIPFSNDEDSKIIQNAYPNINIKEFYFNIIRQKSACFIAICRKEYIDNLIKVYLNKNVYVVNVSFGNHALLNVKDYIDSDEIYTSNALIKKDKNEIKDIIKQTIERTHNYNINGLNVSSAFLLSFAATLNLVLLQKGNEHSNFESKYNILIDNYQQKRFFSQFLKIGLLFILTILFFNFFIFNHYFNRVTELKQTSQINQSSKQKLIILKEDLDKKEKIINDILKTESSKSSFYANAIMTSLPESIRISEFNFQPLTKRINPDKPIESELNRIVLNGVSATMVDIPIWISKLEEIEWIEEIVITEFGESNKSLTEFSLNIIIK
ncbi:hypothetical protein BZARG_370 [Bizionia argentinensis JUB59]|uniref:General secretion pathway protein n=1 Tax=Bizionia argentinensis JUB59 TaxID=1046627 RepID=G2EGY3_9FLAO|nr:hypothetical protein [Bizionia argentinensis]EGV42212.1 hypothetical protein BZARG_370 [Bizionia argentinensis JUB59]